MPKNAIDKAIELCEYFGETLHDWLNWFRVAIYAIFISLHIDTGLMEILSKLMILDTALGVIKVFFLKYKFSFKKLIWGFTTKLLVLVIPMIVALIGKGLGEDFMWAVTFTMKILIINEGLSCLTNILSSKSGAEVQNIDLITILLHNLRRILIGISKRIFGDAIKNSLDEISRNHKKEE